MLKPQPWAILLRSSNCRLEPDYDHDHVKLSDRTGTHAQWDYCKLLRGKVIILEILGFELTNLAPVVCGTIGRLLRQDRIGVWDYYGAVAAVESQSQG
jgi:hypothetical protein